MLTDKNIERRCRYRLAKNGFRMKKENGNFGPVYYIYEIDGDDSRPDDDDQYAWKSLNQVLDYCEELAEKNREAK